MIGPDPNTPVIATATAPDSPASLWSSPSNMHTLALLAITVLGLFLCFKMARPFLSPLAWALALAVLVLPLQRWLERRIKSRSLATSLAVLAAALVVVVPVILVTSSMLNEAMIGAAQVQVQVESGQWRMLLNGHPRLTALVEWVDQSLNIPSTLSAASGALTELAGDFLKGSLRQAVQLLLTFYLLFYLLRDRQLVLRAIRKLSPLSGVQMDRLYRNLGDTLHATLYGTFAVALVQGTLGGLMFWVLDLPTPLLWGVVMGLLAIVPVLGAFVVWIPAALYLLLSGQAGSALLLSVWGTVVVGGIDNLLYPILVGNRLRMHTVLVFISIVGGLLVFGAAGLIVGPVVLTVTAMLLEVWRHPDADVAECAVASVDSRS